MILPDTFPLKVLKQSDNQLLVGREWAGYKVSKKYTLVSFRLISENIFEERILKDIRDKI